MANSQQMVRSQLRQKPARPCGQLPMTSLLDLQQWQLDLLIMNADLGIPQQHGQLCLRNWTRRVQTRTLQQQLN